jgi:hypothetical protein
LTNATTQTLIQQGNWDFTILQEQSQIPSFPLSQVESECFPFAASLNDSIEKYSPCGETVFYQTWGRQNGDSQNCANWPPVCTYEGMDSLLQERYQIMANDNEAIVAAVGTVRRYLRQNYPLFNLYQADGSHPSALGTYAAACTFTSAIFRVSADLITFNGTFTAEEVSAVKEAVNNIVFNDLSTWNIGDFDLDVSFTYALTDNSLVTFGTCISCDSVVWNFGDGYFSSEISPVHTYSPGIYSLNMIGYHCGETSSQYAEIFVEPQTSISGHSLNKAFIVFNNNLTFAQFPQKEEWILLDAQGKKCFTFSAIATNLNILNPGIYFVQNQFSRAATRIVIND